MFKELFSNSCKRVTAINYYSSGTKSVFSFGDINGFFNVFVLFFFNVHIYNKCSHIHYISQLESYAICGVYCRKMVLATLPQPPRQTFSKKIFESPVNQEFFTCVEYSPLYKALVTGGSDGFLRVWLPNNTSFNCNLGSVGNSKQIQSSKK